MSSKRRQRSGNNANRIQTPVDGGKVEKIHALLQYPKSFHRPGSLTEAFLLLKNNTNRRIEGWLTITPPPNWIIEPGKHLMIAIRPAGTIMAEFYLAIPDLPAPGPHLLHIKITAKEELLAEADFDLRAGLLFPVE